MPSFLDSVNRSWKKNTNISDFLKELSGFGLVYNKQLKDNSHAIGLYDDPNEDMYAEFLKGNSKSYHGASTHNRKAISANMDPKEYMRKREKLRGIASQDEIEDILDTLCDEAIVYDEANFFCQPRKIGLDLKGIDDINAKLQENFKNIYIYLGFNVDNTAWSYFNKWLVDGALAFEIIYNDIGNRIIGFKELDAASLSMEVCPDGSVIWHQEVEGNKRDLADAQVVYISYAGIGGYTKVSYVERLIRAFNILRIMEQTRIIWAVVNSSFKMKFVIPVGGKSKTRAQQSLAKLMQQYNEDIDFDDTSGDLTINGKSNLPFNKQIWLPEKDGSTPQIETLGGDGPDLSDTNALVYFENKLKKISKVPFSRFDRENGRGTMDSNPDSIARDEVRFERFLGRLRAIFKEVIVKPLTIQMKLDYPNLAKDMNFISSIKLTFHKYNIFEELKEYDLMGKRIEFINSMIGLQDAEGASIFDARELALHYLKIGEKDPLMTKLAKKPEPEVEGGVDDMDI